MASEPVASAFQGLTLETRRLPKKGVSDSLRKWCKLGLICSEILYKSSRFAHPLNPLQDSSSLSSSPSELPASVVLLKVAIASPFSSKDIGHMPRCRAHRERQSGSRRSPRLWHTDSSRNSSAPPLEGLMASTLKQILKENVKGRLLDYNGYK